MKERGYEVNRKGNQMTLLEKALAVEDEKHIRHCEERDTQQMFELMLAWLQAKISSKQAVAALYGKWKPGSESKMRCKFMGFIRDMVHVGNMTLSLLPEKPAK